MDDQYVNFERFVVIVDNGSGLLFKPSKDALNAFFFTAYHALDNIPSLGDVLAQDDLTVQLIKPEKIDINLSQCSAKCIYVSEKADHDLVVFNIPDTHLLGFTPPVLDIFDGEFDKSLVVGCPTIKKLASSRLKDFECGARRDTDIIKHKYQVNTQQNLFATDENQVENVKGMSGCGVLVYGGDNNYHLAGVIRKSEFFGDFAFTSICNLMDDINSGLSATDTGLKIYAQQCYYECGIDPTQLKIPEIKQAIINTTNNPLLCDYDENRPLESLQNHKNAAYDVYKNIVRKKKELSNYYVLLGILHEEREESRSSTECFKKAIQLDSKNEHIYNEAYMRRGSKLSSENLSKSLYEKNKKSYQTAEEPISAEDTQSSKLKQSLSLSEIIRYHSALYDNQNEYLAGLTDEERYELRIFCEDYIQTDRYEYALESRLLLIEIYIFLGRMAHAKSKCEEFLSERLVSKPTRDEQFILLKLRYLLAIKINQQASLGDWQAFKEFANQRVGDDLVNSYVTYTLEIIESLYDFENDKGLVGKDRLMTLYSPLRTVMHYGSTQLDDIQSQIASSYEEKLSMLRGGGEYRSKENLVEENQTLRQINSIYEDENNTLRSQVQSLEESQQKNKKKVIAREKKHG